MALKLYDEGLLCEKVNFELSIEEQERLKAILEELKQMFNVSGSISVGYPNGISSTDYQDVVIRLDDCYMPFFKRTWR